MEARPFCPAVILSFLLLVFSLPLSAEEVGSTVVFSEAGDVIAVGGACPESDADDESFAWVRSIIVLRFVDNRAPSDLAERLYGALLSKGSDGVLHFFSGGELERPLILVPQRSVFADVGFTSQYVRERYGLVPGNYDVLAVDFYSWGTRSNSGLTLNEALDIAVVELKRFPGSEPESIDWGKISALPATMGCNSGGPGSISCSCDGSFWIVNDGCSVVCGGNTYACCMCTFMPGTSACRCVGGGGGPVDGGPPGGGGGPGGGTPPPGGGDDDDDDDDGGDDEAQ